MKQIFEKVYTRDNNLIIQQVWNKAFTVDFNGNTNPYVPTQVDVITDGVVEIWENQAAIQWFTDRFQTLLTQDSKFFDREMEEYLPKANQIQTFRRKEKFNTLEELENFITFLSTGTRGFLCFYYAAVDERTPSSIRTRAQEIRDQDAFYDNADRLIKASIETLYPRLTGLTISILTQELALPPRQEEMEARFKNCVWSLNQAVYLGTLKEYEALNSEYKFVQEIPPSEMEVKGQVGFKGKTEGRVRIVKRKNQISELIAGEILVAPMTTPDYIPAMKKAIAFVTDEGGITCHAAIIAREMKKPCIIGTKFATQVLKNGDWVEVDANQGIVKIIK